MDNLKDMISGISPAAIRDLERMIQEYLNRCGLFYKLFARIKEADSCCKKIRRKIEEDKKHNYKMQDLVGFRIVLYFKEDIEVCEQIIRDNFDIVDVSKDEEKEKNFGPMRFNYVCKIHEKHGVRIDFDKLEFVDETFELQIRTIFSEGWHEIEHDFRYKALQEWEAHKDFSRTLNGIFATLDTCDWAIASLFDKIAYVHYQEKNWKAMLKQKLRIRLIDDGSDDILELLSSDKDLAKAFFRVERKEFLLCLSKAKGQVPLSISNTIKAINYYQIKNDKILEKTNPALLNILSQMDQNST